MSPAGWWRGYQADAALHDTQRPVKTDHYQHGLQGKRNVIGEDRVHVAAVLFRHAQWQCIDTERIDDYLH